MRVVKSFSFIIFLIIALPATAAIHTFVVADAYTRAPLAHASVFDCKGHPVRACDSKGRVSVDDEDVAYPLTVRYMGYDEARVKSTRCDTVFMDESIMALDEIVVESRQQKLLHILAYAREYSTLASYTDTVTMFREKMVDYMLPTMPKTKAQTWRRPRILNSKSYYRFSNAYGLDSVSDRCGHYFSWADWMGIPPTCVYTADTIAGRYGPAEIWTRSNDRTSIGIDLMADTIGRRWVPALRPFFNDEVEFEQFNMRFNYAANGTDSVTAPDLAGYSFNIASRGRGHGIYLFNRTDEPFFVTTYTEVYILDHEYITVAEAKKWARNLKAMGDIDIYQPESAPDLQPDVQQLIARVESIDHGGVRLGLMPDQRLVSNLITRRRNFGQHVLRALKTMCGINAVIGEKKREKDWKQFRRSHTRQNTPVRED